MKRPITSRSRLSYHSRKTRNESRTAIALIGISLAGFAGMFCAAVQIDASNGITPAESMCNNGFSAYCSPHRKMAADIRAKLNYRRSPEVQAARQALGLRELPAMRVRLIGRCNGELMAAMEESAFPAGCDWIEPIKESN